MSEAIILGIETSCDETGVGIVQGSTMLANAVASSMEEHVRFGGVIPEIASRAHLEAMLPTLQKALDDAQITLNDVDAIAVTAGPGLAGALVVGVSAAKALALATGKPLYGVNHLVGHVGAAILDEGLAAHVTDAGPIGALLVSGGHTEILKVNSRSDDVELLGSTIDDAAGEAFDKVARILGLNYPGGPVIDKLAKEGDRRAIRFPRGLSATKYLGTAGEPGPHRYDFSFSGLKTAVARYLETAQKNGEQVNAADVAASFQEAVMDVLTRKAILACQEHGLETLLLGGGVAANSRLRELLRQRCEAAGITLLVPAFQLCTDNGAMIAALGARLHAAGAKPSTLGFAPDSSLPVTQILV